MQHNDRTKLYILPLIDGWSADADLPDICYIVEDMPGSVILEYSGEHVPHNNGVLFHNDENLSFKYLYNICEKFIKDYLLILKGRYSLVSDETKSVLLSRAITQRDFMFIENVLYKNKKLKKYLEDKLDIRNIDLYTNEYDSKLPESVKIKIDNICQ